MKIAIDASKLEIKDKTGTEVYAYQLITGLLKSLPSEHEVILYSSNPLDSSVLNLRSNVVNRVIKARFLWTLVHLSKALWDDKPDVFYTPASIMPPIHPRRSYAVIHGLEYEFFPDNYSFLRFWHLAIFTLLSAKWSHRIIVPSKSTGQDLIQEYQVDGSKIRVIPSGIPDSLPGGKISTRIQKYAEKPYLYWVGRLEQRKNLGVLIQAFEHLKPEYPDLQLILAGMPGQGYFEIKSQIEQSRYQDDIHELGFISDSEKEYLYQKAGVFVFPSWYEGFGFPILEAFRAGVPVVAARSSSLPEVGGKACLYADPELPESFVRQIKRFLSDRSLCQEYRDRAKKHLTRFSFQVTIQKTQNLLLTSD